LASRIGLDEFFNKAVVDLEPFVLELLVLKSKVANEGPHSRNHSQEDRNYDTDGFSIVREPRDKRVIEGMTPVLSVAT